MKRELVDLQGHRKSPHSFEWGDFRFEMVGLTYEHLNIRAVNTDLRNASIIPPWIWVWLIFLSYWIRSRRNSRMPSSRNECWTFFHGYQDSIRDTRSTIRITNFHLIHIEKILWCTTRRILSICTSSIGIARTRSYEESSAIRIPRSSLVYHEKFWRGQWSCGRPCQWHSGHTRCAWGSSIACDHRNIEICCISHHQWEHGKYDSKKKSRYFFHNENVRE